MHGNLNRYSTNTTRILALDLGKFNSVLCVYDPARQEHRFESVQTLPQVMHDLLLKHQTNDPSQTLVVMETCDDRVKLLRTVPGVGPRLAETVVAHLDDPHRFRNAKQVASYAGLVPKQFESGTIKRSCRITRRGPTLLRSMLVEVAWMVYMRNEWARAYVNRISRGMKGRKNIAIVALARKLLVMLWAMLRENQPWRGREDQASRCAADGCGCSPPEDTGLVMALSSVAGAIG